MGEHFTTFAVVEIPNGCKVFVKMRGKNDLRTLKKDFRSPSSMGVP